MADNVQGNPAYNPEPSDDEKLAAQVVKEAEASINNALGYGSHKSGQAMSIPGSMERLAVFKPAPPRGKPLPRSK